MERSRASQGHASILRKTTSGGDYSLPTEHQAESKSKYRISLLQTPVWLVGKRGLLYSEDGKAEGSERLSDSLQVAQLMRWNPNCPEVSFKDLCCGVGRILGIKTGLLGRACQRRAGVNTLSAQSPGECRALHTGAGSSPCQWSVELTRASSLLPLNSCVTWS